LQSALARTFVVGGRQNERTVEARDEGDVSHQGAAREERTDGLEGLAGRARKRLEEKMVPNDASRERECWIERAGEW